MALQKSCDDTVFSMTFIMRTGEFQCDFLVFHKLRETEEPSTALPADVRLLLGVFTVAVPSVPSPPFPGDFTGAPGALWLLPLLLL